jgi:hypothetical protein
MLKFYRELLQHNVIDLQALLGAQTVDHRVVGWSKSRLGAPTLKSCGSGAIHKLLHSFDGLG